MFKRPSWTVSCGALLVLVACGRGGGDGGQDGIDTAHFLQKASFDIEVSGARNARYKGETDLLVLRAKTGDTNIAVMGPEKPVDAGGGTTLEVFAQVGGYNGDGTYTAKPSLGKPSFDSNAYTQLVTRADRTEVFRYDILAKGCTFKIKDGGSSGTATCDALRSEFGGEVALKMTWKSTGPRVNVTTATTAPGASSSSSTSSSTP